MKNLKQDLEYQMSNRVLELKQAIDEENQLLSALRVMSDKEWYDSSPEWSRDYTTRYEDIQIVSSAIKDMEDELRSFTNLPLGSY